MFRFIIDKIIGSQNERELLGYQKNVSVINSLEPEISKFSDDQLRKKTDEFKESIKSKQGQFQQELQDLE